MKKKEIKKQVLYKAVLEMAGNKYTASGKTLFETLDNLKLEWQNIKSKGIMTITHGRRQVEKLFLPKILKRIYVNKIAKHIWAKNLETLLK